MSAPLAADSTQPPPRRGLAATIGRNAVVMTAAGWALKALNFVYFIAVARLLGDESYGIYMAAAAIVGMAGVFLELGLTQYVERTLAQDRARIGALLGNLIALRLALALTGVGAIPAAAILGGYERQIVVAAALMAGTFLFSAVLYPLTVLITSAERYDLSAPLQVTAQLVANLCGLTALLAGFGLFGLLLAGYVALPLQIVLTMRLIRRHDLGPMWTPIDLRAWSGMVRAALPFGLTSLALVFNFNADTVILSRLVEAAEVGWYNAAYSLVFRLVAVADGLLLTMTVSLARGQRDDPAAVRAWTAGTIRWLLLLSLPVAAILSLLAAPAIALLYGPAFAPAAPLLAMLAWDIPLLLFTAFCGNVSAAVGRERPAALIYLGAAMLNVTLNLALIPAFGATAAAAVTLATDALCALLFLVLLREYLLPPRRRAGEQPGSGTTPP